MKTKKFLTGFSIISIAALFIFSAIRDREQVERYNGRPFVDRSNQANQTQTPQFQGNVPIDRESLTTSMVAPPVSAHFGDAYPVADRSVPTFAVSESNDGDDLILLEDETASVSTDDIYSYAASDATELDLGLELPDEEPALASPDEQFESEENPFDCPVQLESPFNKPIKLPADSSSSEAMAGIESEMLPTIENGSGVQRFGVGNSRFAVNPYVNDRSQRVASLDHLQRPVAVPKFDQTSTPLGFDRATTTESMPTSVLLQSEEQQQLDSPAASPSDRIFETPVEVSPNHSESNQDLAPAAVPLDPQPEPHADEQIQPSPAYSYETPVAPSYGHAVPIQNAQPLPAVNTDNVASFNRRNPSIDTYSGTSYLDNSWTASIFQNGHGGSCGNGCQSGFPNEGRWGDTSSVLSFGGWFSAGYHEANNQLFNNRPDNFALHQGWLFAEKSATYDSPLGFRVDAVYGIDGTDTQAFGNEPGNWDYLNGLDYGAYSWAIPQAYLEVALGEFNVRVGHFFTLLGYEVVPARDNFFYSHAMTMYNSEPFTHTGVLVNRSFGNFDVYGGWTLGWDSGFDRFGDAGSWLGGFTYDMSDDASFSYYSTAGNFGSRGDDGYSQSVVLNVALSQNMNYVLQSDYLRVASTGEDNVGVAQYTTYSLTDRVSLGSRLEWWKGDVLTGYAPHDAVLPASGSLSYFAATFGANIRPTDSLVIRPEIRHDWSPAADYDETYFGIDAVWSF